MRDSEEEDAEFFGPTLKVKLFMKAVPVFDETDRYQIKYTGANFPFNDGICDKKIRI